MTITEDQIKLIQSSFERARALEDFSGSKRFYAHFFRRAPEKRAMFRDDIAGQGMKFMGTLKTIISVLDDPAAMQGQIGDLAAGHRAMGVKPRDYDPMLEALLDTFREILGDEFTPDAEAAWRVAYAEIASSMTGRR